LVERIESNVEFVTGWTYPDETRPASMYVDYLGRIALSICYSEILGAPSIHPACNTSLTAHKLRPAYLVRVSGQTLPHDPGPVLVTTWPDLNLDRVAEFLYHSPVDLCPTLGIATLTSPASLKVLGRYFDRVPHLTRASHANTTVTLPCQGYVVPLRFRLVERCPEVIEHATFGTAASMADKSHFAAEKVPASAYTGLPVSPLLEC
jgi:hypothetical protein